MEYGGGLIRLCGSIQWRRDAIKPFAIQSNKNDVF
jgi:hypothetical protein